VLPSLGSQQGQRRPRHRPWYDQEVKAAKAALLPLASRGTPAAKAALQAYRQLIRRKKRQYASQQLQLFRQREQEHPGWRFRAIRPRHRQAPAVDPADMVASVRTAFNGPGMQPAAGPMPAPPQQQQQPAQPQQQQPGAGGGEQQPARLAVDAYLSGDRLQAAAKKLRLGAAPGPPGVPAAAFRHQAVQDAASRVLFSIARAPAQPPAVQCGLLTPAYKGQGSQLDTSKYRRLVVSAVQQLHKLYAKCLLKYALEVLEAGGAVLKRISCAR
jgi:hypothetical protein